ncbi:MAG: hypothetical protein MZV65_10490 [Chromatiales bacterium]|nr:hypothetical protein [Chromatiales bacterium]
MIAKATILDGQEPVQIARIDRVERDRQPPAPIGYGEGAQQASLAVEDLRRAGEFDLGQRSGVDPVVEPQPDTGSSPYDQTDHQQQAGTASPHHEASKRLDPGL